jgi:hypothetical protein
MPLSNALGWMPRCELSVGLGCNQPRDHKVLGWLCAELAGGFDGMVDMNGVLPIPERKGWKEADLSGTLLIALHEYGDEGKLTEFHLADAAFLRTWLQHPNFHMIKQVGPTHDSMEDNAVFRAQLARSVNAERQGRTDASEAPLRDGFSSVPAVTPNPQQCWITGRRNFRRSAGHGPSFP